MDGLFHGVSIYFNGFGGSPILRNPHISRDIPYITGGHNPCGMAILTCVDVLCDPVPLGEARRGADHVPIQLVMALHIPRVMACPHPS